MRSRPLGTRSSAAGQIALISSKAIKSDALDDDFAEVFAEATLAVLEAYDGLGALFFEL